MFTVCCVLKNSNSIEKFQLEFEEEDIKWLNISSLENLKEEILVNNFDLVVLDERIWWLKECEELMSKKISNLTYFRGGLFNPTIEEMKIIISQLKKEEKLQEERYLKYSLESKKDEVLQVPKIQIVEKPVKEIVEKVVYKTKDISKKIYTVISEDNNCFRDYYAINLGTYLSSFKNSKSIVIDITLTQNLINCVNLLKIREINFSKDMNPATILKCCDLIDSEIETYLLRIEEGISKSSLKSLLFNLRDFENIIFCLDTYNKNIPVGYILALSNKVHISLEPVYSSGKKVLSILEVIKDCGQVQDNIKIILTDIVEDLEIWVNLFRNMYEVFQFNRFDVFEYMNQERILKEKKYREIFRKIIGITNNERRTAFFRRRG